MCRFIHRTRHRRGVAVAAVIAVVLACATSMVAEPARPVDLHAAERRVFSQFGEDGVIEKIFEVIEPGPKFAVEFGAANGVKGSNMRNLVVDHGWSTFQIEGNPQLAKALAKNYRDYPTTKTLQAWVWPGNIEILFEENGVPKDLDFMVIDIDSNDYYVWRAIRDFRPKVVMIETNLAFPPPQRMVVDFHPMNYWDGTLYFGASLQSLDDLAKTKGYQLLYQVSGSSNTFWVDERYFAAFGITDNSPAAIYRPPSDTQKLYKQKWGRDGVPWPEGRSHLNWKDLKIPKTFRFDR